MLATRKMMMIKRLFHPLLCPRPFISSARSGKFTSIFPKKFSSQSESNIITSDGIPLLQNPFAQFAATKFNISPADIARMFKACPALQKPKTLEKVEQFVSTLENNGLKPDEITKIMIRDIRLLTASVENTLPKLQLLKESGIEGANMIRVLTMVPGVLSRSLERELVPKITLLKTTFQSHDLFIKAVLRTPSILYYSLEKDLKPSLAFWEGWGIRGMELARFLYSKPSFLRCSSLMPAQLELMHKIGVHKESKMFKYILSAVASHRMETLESKMHNFQLCGLSSEEIMELFRACPLVFTFSTEKVSQTMQFLMNDVGLPANSVVKRPKLLQKNLEKVLKPRFLVLQEIKSLNVLGHCDPKQLYTVIMMPEAKFLSKIVEKHPNSTTLYGVYEKTISDVSSGTKIARKSTYF